MMDSESFTKMERLVEQIIFELVNHPGFSEGEFDDILKKLDRVKDLMNLI